MPQAATIGRPEDAFIRRDRHERTGLVQSRDLEAGEPTSLDVRGGRRTEREGTPACLRLHRASGAASRGRRVCVPSRLSHRR